MTQFNIVGAGMAGLLAGCMLRDKCAMISERSESLPNNHHALLRFRSNIVSRTTGIAFQQVGVIKQVDDPMSPLADNVAYSLKATGQVGIRSLISADGSLNQRFIAPPDFINLMSKKIMAPIKFGHNFEFKHPASNGAIISTIPMPALMDALEYPQELRPEFVSVSGFVAKVDMPEFGDFCGTIYFPHDRYAPYRASIVNRELIMEWSDTRFNYFKKAAPEICSSTSMSKDDLYKFMAIYVLEKFGLWRNFAEKWIEGRVVRHHEMQYAKILPCDDKLRKRFILWATEEHKIYSLGRFATWRPDLLLDDVVNDVHVIEQIAETGTYNHRKN